MNLSEIQPFQYNIIEGSKRPGILMSVGGIFQKSDTENANKRVYPKDLWKEVLSRDDVKERLENRQMVGMLGHPANGSTDPEKISHVITKQELRSDGTVYGEADVLDTPAGRIAGTLFEAGVKLGISSRGDGSVKRQGGKDEVQKDYKLEGYDFVLKPSTPGAYPGIVENVEENEKLVVEAIEGLVNSEVPSDKRLEVLTESLKILSVLDSATTVDQVRSLSEKIQEEVKPMTVLTLEAKDDEPNDTQNSQQETAMNTNQMGTQVPVAPQQQQQVAPDTLKWHQDQVDAAVADAVAQKDDEIDTMKNDLIQAQREHTETKRRLAAAEEIIEEFQDKVKRLSESDNPADEQLQIRYDAAVELLDEALIRLPELGEARRRIEALEGLLEASIEKFQGEKVEEAVKSCLSKVNKALAESARPILEECTTPEKVYETFKNLVAISGGRSSRFNHEPLPGNGAPLQESVGHSTSAPASPLSRIQNRLSKAV
jgi:hypothetical protein